MSKRIKPGDIYAVNLPNGKIAFVKVLNDGAVAVYKATGDSVSDAPTKADYAFFVYIYADSFSKWHFVRHEEFANAEDAWAPPFCWVDAITKKGSLYFRGQKIVCTYEECKNREILAVWSSAQLVDRIMGDRKWEQALPKPQPQND